MLQEFLPVLNRSGVSMQLLEALLDGDKPYCLQAPTVGTHNYYSQTFILPN